MKSFKLLCIFLVVTLSVILFSLPCSAATFWDQDTVFSDVGYLTDVNVQLYRDPDTIYPYSFVLDSSYSFDPVFDSSYNRWGCRISDISNPSSNSDYIYFNADDFSYHMRVIFRINNSSYYSESTSNSIAVTFSVPSAYGTLSNVKCYRYLIDESELSNSVSVLTLNAYNGLTYDICYCIFQATPVGAITNNDWFYIEFDYLPAVSRVGMAFALGDLQIQQSVSPNDLKFYPPFNTNTTDQYVSLEQGLITETQGSADPVIDSVWAGVDASFESNVESFAAVTRLFNRVFDIPFVSDLINFSMSIAILPLIIGIGISAARGSDRRAASDRRRAASEDRRIKKGGG